MEERELTESRIRELSALCYQRDILKHSGFLSLAEQAVYHRVKRELPMEALVAGGHAEADRCLLLFLPSYMDGETAEREVISCVEIRAANERFADALTHRDYLGALMNLGIRRDQLGDILTDGTNAYLFCLSDIAGYIAEELLRVRHTSVRCALCAPEDCEIEPRFEELRVNVASERLDAVIAALYQLSRGAASALIGAEAVFVDGRSVTQSGSILKDGVRVSVRGHGKFIYEGLENTTRKGRLYVRVRKYV